MTQLHAYYHLRNQQAFQRLLDGSAESSKPAQNVSNLSNSGGRSWNKPSPLSAVMACDVNARDWLGMTVLHHACASTEQTSLYYVRTLLAHPGINVNICDLESHWTPLHRALYNGNLPAALLLLQRSDIDISVKDFEGYTAFDLYNSTVEHTKPNPEQLRAELYTWGTNRNAALGQGDSNDRTFPDQVVIHPRDPPSVELPVEARFAPINVRQIQMSKLHTAIVTTESKGNLRLCGFGSGGRLGPGQQAQQYSLKPLTDLNAYTIVSVALGQDHTLVLTNTGEVLSWGLNRFSQLGYIIDPPSGADLSGFSRKDEPIQATPRKIVGPLKKAFVLGVAACKTASACWTSKEVFTWGTNNGQLGYDKSAQSVQILPRVATKLPPYPAEDIALSDTAMVCLLKMDNGTCNVFCIHGDAWSKISFPPHAFPAQIYPYRPPQATTNADIRKVTCCDDTFAALSANGEVFTFSPGNTGLGLDGSGQSSGRASIKPQRVWALRKQFSAVKDVALGSDGSLVVCTESGHVYVRTRSAQTKSSSGHAQGGGGGSNKPFKFQRVPYLQRVVRVCANSTGAFGALRIEFQPRKVVVEGNRMEQDLRTILPGVARPADHARLGIGPRRRLVENVDVAGDVNEGEDDASVQEDNDELKRLCEYIEANTRSFLRPEIPSPRVLKIDVDHGADVLIHVASSKKAGAMPLTTPVHRVILAARSRPLCSILSDSGILRSMDSSIVVRFGPLKSAQATASSVSSKANVLQFEGCHPLAVLTLLVYLYSDQLVALWDSRILFTLRSHFSHMAIQPARIKNDLQGLAKLMELPHLGVALESPAKRDPVPSLCSDLTVLHHNAQSSASISFGSRPRLSSPLAPDVVLKLKERRVWCHSAVLRARSAFFASMFDEEAWTVKRWNDDGVLEINLTHMEWRSMRFVLKFLCCGGDEEMFAVLDDIHSPDELLDLMFEVMAAANELLLDRLVLICSSVILKFASIANACYILSDATFFHSLPLVSSIQEYMAVNMETFLESRTLDDLAFDLVKQLAEYTRAKQAEKLPVTRSQILISHALQKHKGWLDLQDIPVPIVLKNNRTIIRRSSAKLSPPISTKAVPVSRVTSSSNISLPVISSSQAQGDDDIFAMDEADEPTSQAAQGAGSSHAPTAVWKAPSVPRVDMKALMAEEASTILKAPVTPRQEPAQLPGGASSSPKSNQRTPLRESRAPQSRIAAPAGSSRSISSPWGTPNNRPSPGSSAANPPSFPALGTPTSSTNTSGMSSSKPVKPDGSPRHATSFNTTQPGLGPVFSPTRQPASSTTSTPRRVSSGKAWSSPPVQPSTSVLPTSGMSLVAIQQLQLEQAKPPTKERRSLLEIQQEEEDRRAEQDFLRWWASEEQRVKLESEAPKRDRPRRGGGGRKPKVKTTSGVQTAESAEATSRPKNSGSPH